MSEVSIEQIVSLTSIDTPQQESLVAALLAREDLIADGIRQAGVMFGLYPEIVAEVLAEVGLGTPHDEVTRRFIHEQYHQLMQRLQNGTN